MGSVGPEGVQLVELVVQQLQHVHLHTQTPSPIISVSMVVCKQVMKMDRQVGYRKYRGSHPSADSLAVQATWMPNIGVRGAAHMLVCETLRHFDAANANLHL